LAASIAIGVATLIGAFAALALGGVSDRMVSLAFAFSAGIATYVGASDLIPEINHSRNRVIPVLVFAGMVLFYVSKRMLEG
jgi:zinc transporter ZupT